MLDPGDLPENLLHGGSDQRFDLLRGRAGKRNAESDRSGSSRLACPVTNPTFTNIPGYRSAAFSGTVTRAASIRRPSTYTAARFRRRTCSTMDWGISTATRRYRSDSPLMRAVPGLTVSPTSTRRLVTTPAYGARTSVYATPSLALSSAARAAASRATAAHAASGLGGYGTLIHRFDHTVQSPLHGRLPRLSRNDCQSRAPDRSRGSPI